MKEFFISDLHFGHENILRFDYRPWDTVDEMDDALIDRWNRKVTKDDHVYVLGDFVYRNRKPVSYYTEALNGHIHLIRGNHDKRSEQYEKCFSEVVDYKDLVVLADGVRCRLILSHYFMPVYNGAHRMAFMLHGHTHMTQSATLEEKMKAELRDRGARCEAYNVGCMYQNYEPQTFEEIIARQNRNIELI